MKRSVKFLYIAFSVLFLSFLFFNVQASKAQVPPPPVPCVKTDSPEFNTLRPYQASPCGDRPIAYFCSNRIYIYETYTENRRVGGWKPAELVTLSPGFDIQTTYYVELSNVELPILGNTELTKNSTSDIDQIDDAQKMNEYVSWYLNGVNNNAENPPLSGEDEEDIRKIIDFSGPIKKLISLDSLTRTRIDTIESVNTDVSYIDDDTGEKVEGKKRHDQVVGCTILGIPVPCYGNFINQLLNNEKRLSEWENHLPPLREDYDNFSDYNIAYRRWRGESCARIPVPVINKDILFCFNNPLKPDYWSTLFSNIPLSSTEDKKAKVIVGNTANIHAVGKTEIVQNAGTEIIDMPALFYPHTEEGAQLSEFLNNTYAPQDLENEIDYKTTENEREQNGDCRVLNVRSNPGDNMFAEVDPNSYQIKVDYTITKIWCDEAEERVIDNPFPHTVWVQRCEGSAYVPIVTVVKSPYAKEIFKNTTAGSSSTFRRIFPKVEEGAPVECIANLPTVSRATYTLTDGANSHNKLDTEMVVENLTGNKTGSGEETDIYFPFYGSVYEYFLKGIQTALRPKGYGEPITNGECGELICGELPEMPPASGSCALGSYSSRVGSIPDSLVQIIESASQTYNTPPDLILAVMYGEGLFNPGRFSWTDENVANWATCEPIPGCNETGDDNFMGFNGNVFPNIVPNILPDLQALDPNRLPPSQCNLLDSIYAIAYDLHNNADGGGGLPLTCFDINLQGDVPRSCSWERENYASAIKVHESGYTDACLTLEGSCATGGGLGAACPSGDNCETVSNRYSNPSHFGCLWDVAHGQ